MTDNGTDVSEVNEGTAGEANPSTSGENQGSPSPGAGQLQETLNALAQSMQSLESRVNGLQGKKDKEISSLRKDLAEYEKLKEKWGADGAVEQLELRQTLADMQSKLAQLTGSAQNQQPQGSGQQVQAVDPAQVISDFGLDLNDPKVAQIAAKSYGSEAEVMTAIRAYRRSLNAQPSPTPGQVPASPSQRTPAPGVEDLKNKYVSEMLGARGNVGQLKAIKQKYREQGVPVDQLVIT